MAKPTHEVIHPSLYFRIDGELQEVEVGAQLTLSAKKGKNLEARGFVKSLKAVKVLTPGKSSEE